MAIRFFSLIPPGGGSGLTTADNGLTVNPAGNVQLGGALIAPTTIDVTGFPLTIGGLVIANGEVTLTDAPVNPTDVARLQDIAVLTASDGLSLIGQDVRLGGTLTGNVNIDTNRFNFQVIDSSFTNGLTIISDPANAQVELQCGDGSGDIVGLDCAFVPANPGIGVFAYVFANDPVSHNSKGFYIITVDGAVPGQGLGVVVQDAVDGVGMTYQNDYSAAGGLLPRWVPDLGYNQTHFANTPNGALNILASGQTILVAGTKTVAITGVTIGSHAQISLVSQGGTVTTTDKYRVVCTAGNITISAVTNAGTNTVNNLDTSTINYFVIN